MRQPHAFATRLLVALLITPAVAAAQSSTSAPLRGPRQWPPVFQFVQVAPEIYAAIEPQNSTGLVHGNTVFVINDSDVFVVDANHTPAAARATIAQLRAVTSKPVRTIVYTHWHNDHNLGASAFADAYPAPLRIIATDSTRDDMLHRFVEKAKARDSAYYDRQSTVYDTMFANGHDLAGRPLTPWRRVQMADLVKAFRNYYGPAAATGRYLLPTETFGDRMTVFDGAREFDLLGYYHGNTRNDAVIFLPGEKIVITGDILVFPVPYTPPDHLAEWISALRSIKALGATRIVPGHGPVMTDYKYLDLLVETLETITAQVQRAADAKLDRAAAKGKVDVTKFRALFAHSDPVLEDDFDEFSDGVAELAFTEARRSP